MLESVEEGVVYESPSGIPFKVLHLGKHAQDCSWPMVVYVNLIATKDAATGTVWVIAESIFLRTFSTIEPGGPLWDIVNALEND